MRLPSPARNGYFGPTPTHARRRALRSASFSQSTRPEIANAQRLSQYQALGRCFWAAQPPSAYLPRQVQQGKPNPMVRAQAELALNLWSEFDRALTYGYDFDSAIVNYQLIVAVVIKILKAATFKSNSLLLFNTLAPLKLNIKSYLSYIQLNYWNET